MTTEQQDGVAGVHRYKLKPPTFNGDFTMYEEWKYKFQAYMGLQTGDHERLRQTERATTTIAHRLRDSSTDTSRRRQVEAALTRDEIHPDKRDIRRSSNNLQTIPT